MREPNWDALRTALQNGPAVLGLEDYAQSAVLVLMYRATDGWHIVLEKRSDSVDQPGEICLPGGRYEQRDQNGLQTAIREAREELGIAPEMVDILGRLGVLLSPRGTAVEAWAGILKMDALPARLPFDRREVAEVFTLPLEAFLKTDPENYSLLVRLFPEKENGPGHKTTLLPVRKLGLPARYERSWGSFETPVYVYSINNRTIWGLTARLIKEFVRVWLSVHPEVI